MTSVQNHPPLLSGNKFIGIFLFIIFVISSCKQFRKVEYYEEDDPAVVEAPDKNNPTNIDTVKWDSKPDNYPPITDKPRPTPPSKPGEDTTNTTNPGDVTTTPPDNNNNDPKEVHLTEYNIAVVAPFYANKATGGSITSKTSLKTLEFYSGLKMALNEINAQGKYRLNVYTYDTEGSKSKTATILNRPEFSSMNVVIGPMKTEPLKIAAQKFKTSKTTLVSPWNPKTSITSDNPNYIQVSPSLKTHCEAIMQHARKNYSSNKIVLVAKKESKEKDYLKYFQDENKVISKNALAPSLPELEAEYGDNIPLGTYFNPDTTVFIVPSWDDRFVANLLREIYTKKGARHIVVYGLPQWETFERVSYEYYEGLNVHISNTSFVNLSDEKIKMFRRNFFDKYGTVPIENAFLGYDLMLYIGDLLEKRGANFTNYLDLEHSSNYYHTEFKFEKEFSSPTDDNFSNISKFENKYLNILRFKDYQFIKAN